MIIRLRKTAIGILSLSIGLLSHQAWAENSSVHKGLTLSSSMTAAMAAIRQCQKDGYKVSVAIVDQSGLLKVQLKADGAGPHTLDSSRRKAYTANSLRAPTQKFAEMVAKKPELQGLARMNENILLLGGGFPIRMRGEIVGGVGVGGAPGIVFDEICASAALKYLNADETYQKGHK